MVTEFGMSDALGPMRFGKAQGEVFLGRDLGTTPDYSDEVAASIDAEVRRLVDDARTWRPGRSSRRTAPCSTASPTSSSSTRRSRPSGSRRSSRPVRAMGRRARRRHGPQRHRGRVARRQRPASHGGSRDHERRRPRGRRGRRARAASTSRAIEHAVREILEAIGEDPDRDGLRDTPRRIADMYEEIFAGLHEDPTHHLTITFEADHDEMVMVRDIPLYQQCEHHLVPFAGQAHVAYIPDDDGRITGLSKLARLVEGFARRPQVQERLTTQIADALVDVLDAARVRRRSRRSTCACRCAGVKKAGSLTVTSAVRGLFKENPATRAEAMSFIGHPGGPA